MLATASCLLFLQKAPSQMFDRFLDMYLGGYCRHYLLKDYLCLNSQCFWEVSAKNDAILEKFLCMRHLRRNVKKTEKWLIYRWLQTYLSFFSEILNTLPIHNFFCFLKVWISQQLNSVVTRCIFLLLNWHGHQNVEPKFVRTKSAKKHFKPIVMQNILIFYRSLVMFVVTCFQSVSLV